MTRHFCYTAGVFFLAALPAWADPPPMPQPPAQPQPPAAAPDDSHKDDYRQFFKKPETTEEYWRALRYEIEVGRYDLASGLLHGLLAKMPTEDELLMLEDKYGMASFLELRTVDWSKDPAVKAQAAKDAGQLIDMVREAVKKKLNDPTKIQLYIKNLNGEREEHDFALGELGRSGAQVVPYLLGALQSAPPEDRPALLDALRRLGPEALPPLYAALDSDIPTLQLYVLDVLRQRAAAGAVPYLWRLTAESQPDDVRRRAVRVLADLLDADPTKLPAPQVALTRLAEGYYYHKVAFPNPKEVMVWRWDPAAKQVVRGWPGAETVTAEQAEEYYGTRFAREALQFDPTYGPAQNVFLSLALERGARRAAPLPGKETPEARDLLFRVNPDLITAVLERALDEHRPEVIVPAVEALGGMDDVRAGRPGDHGQPALGRALNYPDRRVQMAAADALMRIPGQPDGPTAGRIVEVWRRALAAEPTTKAVPKIIVGYFDGDTDNKVADAVKAAGFEPIQARTGRDVLNRLNQAADVDLVLIDAALPDPGLASLLAQLRADIHYGRLPVVVTVNQKPDDVLGRELEELRKQLDEAANSTWRSDGVRKR